MSTPTQPRVLIVLTSVGSFNNKGEDTPTGWYLSEFAHPYDVLRGLTDLTIASPRGGKSPLDPASVDASKKDEISMNFHDNNKSLWENTEKLESFVGRAQDFDAIFFVGGHGPMWDLATDSTSHKIINEFHKANKVIAAVCHGPAALANVKLDDGSYFLKGQPVTGFSNIEEMTAGYSASMPFKLEDRLNEVSENNFHKALLPFGERVEIGHGGRLITGQNPTSAKKVGEEILNALKNRQ